MNGRYDAVIVGSGPNGLTAAIVLARAGWHVLVLEAQPDLGGGTRSAELTLPGYVHDTCSAVHPLGFASPYLRRLPLAAHGLAWVQPPAPLAHPFDDGAAAVLERSLAATAAGLGRDGAAWTRLMQPFVTHPDELLHDVLAPLQLPRRPLLLARFGLQALRSAAGIAGRFAEECAPALFGGIAAHAVLPLEQRASAAAGLVLAVAGQTGGWPVVRGGSQRLADALSAYLRALGGELETDRHVRSLADLPPASAVLFDTTPRQLLSIAGDALPGWYRRQLRRFRHGPGVFKVDWALDGPIPWRAEACRRAGTVHLGGTFAEVAAAERAVARGGHPDRPFVLLAQPSLFDDSRAPAGRQTVWAYCHVPSGSPVDMTARIEAQVERFAPGFRDRILARHVMSPAAMEAHNANYLGGDISGGIGDLRQLLLRPAPRLNPYTTPNPRLFLCSSSTPPGGGVHGMCGYWAARAVLGRSPRDDERSRAKEDEA